MKIISDQPAKEEIEPRDRSATYFWGDKQVIQFLRKSLPKSEYRNVKDVYLALCEIDSDLDEIKHIDIPESDFWEGLVETCSTYAGVSQNEAKSSMDKLKKLGLIDYSNEKGNTYLVLYEFDSPNLENK